MVVAQWLIYFLIYSIIGWVYESFICSVYEKRLVNRGFLSGPFCPVYGFGALAALIILDNKTDSILLLFLAGTLLTSTVEYITSVLLEKLFNAKWWDYSKRRFNIQGRIYLLGAVVFGSMSVLLVKYIHPFVLNQVTRLSYTVQIGIVSAAFFILLVDLFITVRHLLLLNGRLQEIQAAMNGFLGQYSHRIEELKKTVIENFEENSLFEQYTRRVTELRNSLLESFEESEFYNENIKFMLDHSRLQNKRIIRAFPKLRSISYDDAWQKLKETIQNRSGRS